jgi:hypothetical protein
MKLRLILPVVCLAVLGACETPQFPTVVIYDSPQRFVRLQVMGDANAGTVFTHPVDLSEDILSKILKGVYVEIESSTISTFFGGGSSPVKRRAFSDAEVKFFTPFLVRGLAQATPEEMVTFFETAEVSELYQRTTSGGVFTKGDALFVLISNYNVKTEIWQDNEEYTAPFRLRPLDSIAPQPGRLVYESPNLMVDSQSLGMGSFIKGRPWIVGVRYKDLE